MVASSIPCCYQRHESSEYEHDLEVDKERSHLYQQLSHKTTDSGLTGNDRVDEAVAVATLCELMGPARVVIGVALETTGVVEGID